MGIKFVEQMFSICDDLAAQAAGLVEPHDDAELAAFAEMLCGLEGMNLIELRSRLAGLEIPGDFRHLRLHNLTNGMPWGGRYCMNQSRLTLDELLIIMTCVIPRDDLTPQGPGVWSGTVALPIKDPGVLELGLIFQPLH